MTFAAFPVAHDRAVADKCETCVGKRLAAVGFQIADTSPGHPLVG